jgi:uncharacterized membrane protein YjjP (DUF1212 family)
MTAPAQTLLVRLAEVLHDSGVGTPRVEEAVMQCARAIGLEAQVLATPTSLMLSIGKGPVQMRRASQGDIHLARLDAIDDLLTRLDVGAIDPSAALAELETIAVSPAPLPPALDSFAFALASGGAACFFGGSASDALSALILGAAIGRLLGWAGAPAGWARIAVPMACAMAALLAYGAERLGLPIDGARVSLAALIVLVPGYSVTVAMTELAQQHLVSGTARLAGVLGTLFGMGLGAGLGRALAQQLPSDWLGSSASWSSFGPWTEPLGPAWSLLALVTAPLCFTVLFRARPKDAPWIIIGGMLAFLGARFGVRLFGAELGAFTGALLLGAFASLVARGTGRPVSTVLVPGLMLLVPGSMGFRSVDAFLSNDALSGVEGAFHMLLAAAALGAGLLTSQVLVPSRRVL